VQKLGGMLESGQVIPQFQVKPLTIIFNLRNTYVLCSYNKHLRKLLAKPDEFLTAHYSDPGFRALVKTEFAENSLAKGFFDRVRVLDGGSDEVKELMKTGKSISQIARERGVDPTDCMFDIILNDHLDTAFAFAAAAYEPEGVKNLITDGRFLPGVADSGAHIQALNDSGAVTHLLGHWCRDKQVVSLEEGVRLITAFPADVFGIKHRGRIAKGNYADFALVDYDKVGSCMAEYVNDLPGGRRRMISRATGVEATIVNGQVLFDRGKHSGAFPGKMLRSRAQ
jgi:N-acyl-D-aspartate/D-glutamate deacylase